MGSCLSKCIVSDMANEIENELEDFGRVPIETPQPPTVSTTSAFGTTTLLAADEVVCKEAIGDGPSGVVYHGKYRGSVVAVKKMRMMAIPTKTSARETIEASLEVEASRMGSLRHPNTVLFMGACLQDGYFCIVSEYCTRGSLFDVLHKIKQDSGLHKRTAPNSATAIKRGTSMDSSGASKHRSKLKWSLRLRLALGAARGLLYLHSADPPLVHGQLKSTNILVDDSWNAKLADFGTRRVAEAVGFDRARLESVKQDAALLRWTAPEVLKLGEDRVRRGRLPQNMPGPQAVDVYSFGIIMWELTTGELPFADLTSNKEIHDQVRAGLRPSLKPGLCSMQWAELMTRCWAHNAAQRPSAAEIVSSLESISKAESLAQQERRHPRGVVSSNRADYRYASASMKRPKAKSTSRFSGNVRAPDA